jgi:hypothetical protein
MRNKILIFLFSIISWNGFSQDDHLEPDDGYFDLQKYSYEYYSKIRSILFKGLSDSPEIRYFVKPSFDTEYVLQIEYDRDNDNYFIVFQRAKESIWYKKDKQNIIVEIKRNRISKGDVELIKDLYINAIKKTQFIERDIIGLDGTTYVFTVFDFGLKTGQTRSPKKDTKMDELIHISEKLIGETKAMDFLGLSHRLKNKIKELSDRIALSNEESELHLRNFVRDTILSYLNKNLTISSDDLQRASGKIKSVIRQKESGVKWIDNWYYNYGERKIRRKFKNALTNLDLSFLDLETNLLLKLDFRYDEKSNNLILPKNDLW